MRLRARFEFKPADCWVGVFWRRGKDVMECDTDGVWHVWICLLPMVPLHLRFARDAWGVSHDQ